MTSGRRVWVETMIARLAPRAAALRDQPGRGPANIAHVLAGFVSRFEAELAVEEIAPATSAGSADIAKLESSLAAIQPRAGPYGIIINGGDMMDRVRLQLACRLAELRGELAPASPVTRPVPPALELAPVPEALPFVAGPQLALFEAAA